MGITFRCFSVCAAFFSIGCANRILLEAPRDAAMVAVGSDASPEFSWRTWKEVDPFLLKEYTLTVATRPDFRDDAVLYRQGHLRTEKHSIPTGEVWLRGGVEYFWRVDGITINDAGERHGELHCLKPQSFEVHPRPEVKINVRVPKGDGISGAVVRIGEIEFRSDGAIRMESGETRSIEVSFRSAQGLESIRGDIEISKLRDSATTSVEFEALPADVLLKLCHGGVESRALQADGVNYALVSLGRVEVPQEFLE
ncbi:MAG: hypothetical protein AAF517_02520 [Planctomycetota bacterium]